MEYNGGSRDRGPLDPYSRDQEGDDYSGSAPDRGDSSYGRQDYGQSPYSRSPYEQSPYNGGGYGDYGESYRQDRDDYGAERRSSYSAERGGDYGRDAYGGYDRDASADRPEANYDRGEYPSDRRYDTGRNYRHSDERYDRDAQESAYSGARASVQDDYAGMYGRDADDLDQTGRRRAPRESYDRADYARGDSDYARDPYGYGREDDLGQTGRRRAPRNDYGAVNDDVSLDTDLYDDDEEEPRPKKKKKRNKVARFFRGLGAYIAQLPTQTLVLFGGIVAVVLVGIILLVVLLPKTDKTAEPADNGQLSIADITPTPSLPPTIAPAAETAVPTETPVVDPFNGTYIKTIGEENDVIPSVQERLVELGYMEMPEGGYTKRFGTATKTGVRMFQIKNYTDSADWDGILGLGTYTLLMSDEAKPFYLARGDGDSRTAEITALVDAVKKLQARLVELGYLGAGSDTGVFGSGTATAVKTFQQYHGLLADGWAGQSTLDMLYSDKAMTATVGAANPYTPTPDPANAGAVAATTTADPNAAATTTDPAAASVDGTTPAGTVAN